MTVEKVRGEKRVIRNAGPIVNVRVNGAGNEGSVLQQEEHAATVRGYSIVSRMERQIEWY